MMKHFLNLLLGIVVSLLMSCSNPTKFTAKSKKEKLLTLSGKTVEFADVLEKHKGKKLLIDIWASWCKDCIVGLPDVKIMQQNFTEVSFIFLSKDKNITSWKKGIKHYNIKGDHYLIKERKGALSSFLNIGWIPRYVIVDKQGAISLFKATKITDKAILMALKE